MAIVKGISDGPVLRAAEKLEVYKYKAMPLATDEWRRGYRAGLSDGINILRELDAEVVSIKDMEKTASRKSYTLRLGHRGCGGPYLFSVNVPSDVAPDTVRKAVADRMAEMGSDGGICPTELMDSVCSGQGWAWEGFEFDVDIGDICGPSGGASDSH